MKSCFACRTLGQQYPVHDGVAAGAAAGPAQGPGQGLLRDYSKAAHPRLTHYHTDRLDMINYLQLTLLISFLERI